MPSSPPNPHREPGRQHPVHWPTKESDHRAIIVFATICTHDRKPILHRADAVAAIRNAWLKANAWPVGRYVIMPDQVHLFCSPHLTEVSLDRWISYWKSEASRHWPRPERTACLATGFLGHAIAPGRQLCGQMGLCAPEPSATRPRPRSRGLALGRRNRRPDVARRVAVSRWRAIPQLRDRRPDQGADGAAPSKALQGFLRCGLVSRGVRRFSARR